MNIFINNLKTIKLKHILVFLGIIMFAFFMQKLFGIMLAFIFMVVTFGFYLFFIFREHINWGASPIYEWITIVVMGIIAYFMGNAIANEDFWPVQIIVVYIYVIFLFKKPEYVFLISIVLITNMFCLINPDYFSLKGIFKLRDLLLIIPFLPLMTKELINRKNIPFIFGSITAKAIFGICFIISLFILATVLRYSYPIALSFKIARDYFYFLFFFSVLYSIKGRKQLNFVIKAMIVLSFLFAVLYSVQALSGGKINPFPFYRGTSGLNWGVPLARGYVSFGFEGVILFALIGVVGFIDSNQVKLKFWLMIIVVFLGMAYFLSLGRSGWYCAILAIIFNWILLPVERKNMFAKWVIKTSAIFLLSLFLIGVIRYHSPAVLIIGGIGRFRSGLTEMQTRSGTFGARAKVFEGFLDKGVKENLLFGMGFLYPDEGISNTLPYRTVIYVDSGLVTLLNTMGLIGCLIYIWLNIMFVWRSFYIFHRLHTPVYKGFLISFLAGLLVGWVTIFTYPGLTNYTDIVLTAMYLGLNEVMYKVDVIDTQNQNGTIDNNFEL
ncbi:MAG: hypothetical protein PHE49_01825 [bacterium]|nr:hypothetical protein [bacterium]